MSTILKSVKYRGEKILYPDGVGCCIWIPFDKDEDAGIGFDFPFEDIDDIIKLLQIIKESEPDIFSED